MLILFGIFAFFIKYDYVIVLIMYNGLAGLVIFYGIHILLFCIIDYIRCRKEINNVVNGWAYWKKKWYFFTGNIE